MPTRTWAGSSAVWSDPSSWVGGIAPSLGDTAVIAEGTAFLNPGMTIDAATIDLGSLSSMAPATLVMQEALLGYGTTIDSTGAGDEALLVDAGTSGFDGVINATAAGGGFVIGTYASGATGGDLLLLSGSTVTDAGGDAMALSGTLTNEATVDIGGGGNFINDGTITQAAGAFEVESGGTLSGSGLFEIGLYSSLNFQAGSAASSETVEFTDAGGRLLLADPADYTGTIEDMRVGDLIDLTDADANSAGYNPATGLLTVTENGTVVATLTLDAPAGASFVTASDGNGGTLVELTGTETRLDYTIDASDRGVGANVVRATMTTHGGAPITGAGIRIGIISTSFDEAPGVGTADVANAAAEAGYLPENPNGTSAVTIISDAVGSGDDNEGLAMAELVHQVAPGASIDFATGEGGLNAFANAVTSLQDAGCNIIVDDLGYDEEPFFQDAGPLDQAIDQAAADGVTYVSAAGNDGSQAYQASFTATPETLYDGTSANAQLFGSGTPYQTLTLTGGVTASIDLQWAAPWLSEGEETPTLLTAKLFNASGDLVATSLPYGGPFEDNEPGTELTFTPTATGQYQLAIYGALPADTTFKYILLGSEGGGSTVAGTIDDPAADAGTIKGHAMLPDVISVGAVDFPNTPGFGATSGYTSFYSSSGDAEFLFNSAGDAITADDVAKPNVVAPVEAATSVAGFAPFAGTSAAAPVAAAVAALMLQANPSLTPAEIQSLMEESASSLGQPADLQGDGVVNAQAAVQLALDFVPCYVSGTRLAAARGLVAVERLCVGDLLVTQAGKLRPVVWLGHRHVDCQRHARPAEIWPVRIEAHAFAPQQPARDLWLSPDHAVKVGDALVPIRYLVNGATIAQVEVRSVTYWHVELPAHDVLLAEGLPAESYLDTGNRAALASGTIAALNPDVSRRIWAERGCLPLLTKGAAVAAAQARLRARALSLGHRIGGDPRLELIAGGRALALHRDGTHCHVRLPRAAETLCLRSRGWVPAHFGEPDARRLGVAIGGLTLDGRAVDLADPRLGPGWHAPEQLWRWTDGAATLRAAGARELAFDLVLGGRYWQARGAAPRPGRGRRPRTPILWELGS